MNNLPQATPLSARLDLPNNPEIIAVSASADQVKCNGGGGALGHPVVWYNFDGRAQVECLYCDRVFKKPS